MDYTFYLLVFLLWVFYAVLHSVMASLSFKKYAQQWMGHNFKYYRLLYSCIAAVLLVLVVVFQFSRPGKVLIRDSWPLFIVAIPLSISGLVIMAICIKKYFMNLSGVDVLLKRETQPLLEQSGLHRHVRHPLYSGTLLFIWALFLFMPWLSNLIACMVITVYTLVGIRIEERKLVIEFGDEYTSYARRTPMLIPFFRKKPPAGPKNYAGTM